MHTNIIIHKHVWRFQQRGWLAIVYPALTYLNQNIQTVICRDGRSASELLKARRRLTWKRRNWWINALFLFSKSIFFIASVNCGWTTDFPWTILMTSLLPFWVLNMSVVLLFMEGLRALRFHQKYIYLCSEDERRSYGFGTTWGE